MKFFDELGSGSPSQIPDESAGGDDEEFEKTEERKITLYKISDANGKDRLVESIAERPLRQEMLKTEDCFILDTGVAGIFVWVGKRATQKEKTESIAKAQQFLQTEKYPAWTQVHRIVEGAETAPFKQYFASWRDLGCSHSLRAALTGEESDFDAEVLHKMKKSGGRALGFMPDMGEGTAEIFVVQDLKLIPVEARARGMFFGGDSYVVKYEIDHAYGGKYLIYYWQGRDSTEEEKEWSEKFANKMDAELHGKATQIRVVQGHEPRHFLRVFKGKLIIFSGGHASGFRSIHDHDTYDKNGTRLFRIRGTNVDDVRADQLPERASSLASDDVFIVETAKATYIWHGKGGSDIEKKMADSVAKIVSPDRSAKIIREGAEPADFWSALGGKAKYDTEIDPPGAPLLEPRLFHCSILNNGKFRVEEIGAFEQEDLDEDDIMVLDGGDEVYVWVGKKSTKEEKEKSVGMAKV